MAESTQTRHFYDGAEILALWTGVLAPPVIFLASLETKYWLVYWACVHHRMFPLHLVSVLALGLSLGAGMIARRAHIRAGDEPEDGGGALSLSRFMAELGIVMAALFSLAIVAQWIPDFILGPCQR